MEQQTTETQIRMRDNLGTITLKLYNETPLHRDNFIKLVKKVNTKDYSFTVLLRDSQFREGDVTSKNTDKQAVGMH